MEQPRETNTAISITDQIKQVLRSYRAMQYQTIRWQC